LAISRFIAENLEHSSWIRRMFDEGLKLKARFGAENVFDFSLGNPDIEPPAAFARTVVELASSAERGTHGYMPNVGYPDVRKKVAARASRDQGLDIPASSIVMTVGAAGGLNVILKTLLNPGDEVIVIKPYFAEYLFYVQNFGGVFKPVMPRADFSPDPEAIAAALTPRTACVILNSPNNPTGRVYSREDIAAVARVLEAHGRASGRMPYLIADEPYREIVYGGVEVPSLMEAYAETLVVTSWSKTLSLPGERIGYIAVSPRASEPAQLLAGLAFSTRVLGFVNAPALMQRAVASLLEEVCDVASYEKRGKLLAEGLASAGYDFATPQGAFYIFVRVPSGGAGRLEAMTREVEATGEPDVTPDVAYAMHLKKHNVLAVPGAGFGYPGYFRLSFCVAEETIRGSLAYFRDALEEWRKPAGRGTEKI